jgi:hypothetical protein
MQFHGSLQQLQNLVATLGLPCHWEHKGAFEMAVFDDGESNLRLNWWPGSGVVQLVGDPAQRVDLEKRLARELAAAD